MDTASLAAIIIAVIGMAGTVWAAKVSNSNQKDTKTIKEVLSNTKNPVESLDQVIKSMQDEMQERDKRQQSEIKYFINQVEDLRAALSHCQHERSNLTTELEEVQKILKRHEAALKKNGV